MIPPAFLFTRSFLSLYISDIIDASVLFQLCADGKQLLDTLQTPVSSGSSNSITAKADYTEGAAHVLDVVHEVRSVSSCGS